MSDIHKIALLLNKSALTVRGIILNEDVSWGIAIPSDGKKRHNYIIYWEKFYEETGFTEGRVEEVIAKTEKIKQFV